MTPSLAPRLRIAALALAVMAACQPGTPPHPVSPSAGFTVSGRVSGTVSAGATVRLQGGLFVLRFAATDADGRFAFADLERGEYDVTPLGGAEVAFAPGARRATVVAGDVTGLDFVSSAANVVQGTIPGVGASEVVVTLEGPVPATRATDAAGAYRVAGLPDGTYLVRAAAAPLAPLRSLLPNGAEVTVRGGVTVTRDFRAVAATGLHALSGTVTGASVAGVEVRLVAPPQATIGVTGVTRTDAAGRYAFAGLPDDVYALVAVPAAGTLFRQADRVTALAGADVAGLDFEAYAPRAPRFAYLGAWADATATTGAIFQFSRGADGALAPLAPASVPAANRVSALATTPDGRRVYAALEGAGLLLQFAVGADGQLAPLSPASVASDPNTSLLAMDPGGAWLWAFSASAQSVQLFAIGADGALEPRPGQTVAAGLSVTDMAVHPSGRSLYLAAPAAGLLQYAVGADGSLTPLVPALAPLHTNPLGLVWNATQYYAVAADPSGRFVYATLYDPIRTELKSAVLVFRVGLDGGLTPPVGPGGGDAVPATFSIIWSGGGPTSVVAEPGGRSVYAGYQGNLAFPTTRLEQYATRPEAGLGFRLPDSVQGGPNQRAMAADPGGRWLYVVNAALNQTSAPGSVSWLAIGEDGALAPAGSATAGYVPTSIVLAGE